MKPHAPLLHTAAEAPAGRYHRSNPSQTAWAIIGLISAGRAARPVVRQAKVVKEKRATISHAAGTYHFRPETRAPVRGLYFAGDWVRTGIPATIESAVCSGHMAAAAVLER